MPNNITLYESLSDEQKVRYDYIAGMAEDSAVSTIRLAEVAGMWTARASALKAELPSLDDRQYAERRAHVLAEIHQAEAEAELATANSGDEANRAKDMEAAAYEFLHTRSSL